MRLNLDPLCPETRSPKGLGHSLLNFFNRAIFLDEASYLCGEICDYDTKG